jgi:DNA-directed RNA polymerase specialized sigma24 family protein
MRANSGYGAQAQVLLQRDYLCWRISSSIRVRLNLHRFDQLENLSFAIALADKAEMCRRDFPLAVNKEGRRERIDSAILFLDALIVDHDSVVHCSLSHERLGEEDGFRPRQVRAWTDNPEQVYAKRKMRTPVENVVRKLPLNYRAVVVLRDIEQLSTEEAAAGLGLGIPALKARLIRVRLMLREALAPRFAQGALGGDS